MRSCKHELTCCYRAPCERSFSPRSARGQARDTAFCFSSSSMPSFPCAMLSTTRSMGPSSRDARRRPTALRRRLTRAIGIIAQSRRALSLSALAVAGPALRPSRRKVGSDIVPFLRPRAKFSTERLQHGPRILLGGVVALPDRPGLREDGGELPSISVPPCPGVRQVQLARPP